ncbi:hypothetical protein BYT27DRAFT_6432051 [Phlegmacium glaucopus]|nr:hypothetical protein BYT27DRAFT_6432051 [Phlegmacium glaucopus]
MSLPRFAQSSICVKGEAFFDIQGGYHVHGQKRPGFDFLFESVPQGAFHNSAERFDPPKCHPSTRLVILFASRAEHHIQASFHDDQVQNSLLSIPLDHSYCLDVDIREFISIRFREIRDKHPLKLYFKTVAFDQSDNHQIGLTRNWILNR